MTQDEVISSVKHGVDLLSLSVTVATLASWLPNMAALLTVIWTAIRILETATVRGLFGRAPLSGKHD